MSEENNDLAEAWFAKAGGDLAVAELLIIGKRAHLDSGVYHCQQAAEKVLKALLTLDELPFPKTHNLQILLELALPLHPEIIDLKTDCLLLTPYATEFRYPGDVTEPTMAEAEEGLSMATRIVQEVKRLMHADRN